MSNFWGYFSRSGHGDSAASIWMQRAGQAVLTRAGERVRYSTPMGADYVAICLPAFDNRTVHREGSGDEAAE